jgi:hypothetical protein
MLLDQDRLHAEVQVHAGLHFVDVSIVLDGLLHHDSRHAAYRVELRQLFEEPVRDVVLVALDLDLVVEHPFVEPFWQPVLLLHYNIII